NLANNSATDMTDVTLQANLAMEKTGPASAVSGTTVTYTLVASNLGPSTATDVVVTDPTPAGLPSPLVSDPAARRLPPHPGRPPPRPPGPPTPPLTPRATAATPPPT